MLILISSSQVCVSDHQLFVMQLYLSAFPIAAAQSSPGSDHVCGNDSVSDGWRYQCQTGSDGGPNELKRPTPPFSRNSPSLSSFHHYFVNLYLYFFSMIWNNKKKNSVQFCSNLIYFIINLIFLIWCDVIVLSCIFCLF